VKITTAIPSLRVQTFRQLCRDTYYYVIHYSRDSISSRKNELSLENLLFRPKCLLQPIHLGCRRHIRLYIPPLNTISELPKDFSGGPSIFHGYPSHVHLTTRAHSDDLLSKAHAGSLYFETSPKESLNPCKSGRTKFLLCDREKRRSPSELPCANCTGVHHGCRIKSQSAALRVGH